MARFPQLHRVLGQTPPAILAGAGLVLIIGPLMPVGIVLGSFLLGAMRVWLSHPALRAGYRQWLLIGPWAPGRPLPLGPVGLTTIDLWILSLLSLEGALLLTWFAPLAGFGIGYGLLAAGAAHVSGARVEAWMAVGVVAALLGAEGNALAEIVWLLGGYVCLLWALERSVRSFPIRAEAMQRYVERIRMGAGSSRPQARPDDRLGWPLDALRPEPPGAMIETVDALGASFLVGWIVLLLLFVGGPASAEDLQTLVVLSLLLGGIWRVSRYVACADSPIGIIGRIVKLRLVVPGYDRIFVAPAVAILLVVCTPGPLMAAGCPAWLVLPAAATAGYVILLHGGPGLQEWLMTGTIRLRPIGRTGTSFGATARR